MEKFDVIVIGGGTAGSNSARAAVKAGAQKVLMIHKEELNNTCVEEGCMPSKSILAGAHQHESLNEIMETKNAHITRLITALTNSFNNEKFSVLKGEVKFVDKETIEVKTGSEYLKYTADNFVIATGSHPFTPPIEGLDKLGDKILLSEDVVAKKAHFSSIPKRVLTIGGGPIGLELSTFFHDLGTEVEVLQRGNALGLFDPEFGNERVRASKDSKSFPIHLNANLTKVEVIDNQVLCTIEKDDEVKQEKYDFVLVATGRRANVDGYGLENTDVSLDERHNIIHNEFLQTTQENIFVAGDVTGHHQILHFAAEMGKIAGHNTQNKDDMQKMDYDKHMLAVSFDQFPSALIGLTENEAKKRGIEVVTATKHFNSIGLGILKRQEYGLWKLVAEKETGQIIGSQIVGPDSAGELIQILVPIIANKNTYGDIMKMTWYHPTYGEILLSMARDMCKEDGTFCPGN